jgi:hypothetical protein
LGPPSVFGVGTATDFPRGQSGAEVRPATPTQSRRKDRFPSAVVDRARAAGGLGAGCRGLIDPLLVAIPKGRTLPGAARSVRQARPPDGERRPTRGWRSVDEDHRLILVRIESADSPQNVHDSPLTANRLPPLYAQLRKVTSSLPAGQRRAPQSCRGSRLEAFNASYQQLQGPMVKRLLTEPGHGRAVGGPPWRPQSGPLG